MAVWCACALAAMAAACNAQLVTGVAVGQEHWQYIGNTFLALVLGVWAVRRARFGERDWIWFAGATCLLAFPRVVSYAALHYPIYALEASQEEAFDWLDRHTPPDAVVAALSPAVNMRLPVYTHDKTVVSFVTPLASDVTVAENEKRLAYALSLYGAKAADYFRQGEDVSGRWGEKLWGGVVDADSRERSGQLWTHFTGVDHDKIRRDLEDAQRGSIADFGAEYVWVGRFERTLAGPGFPGRRDRLTKVFGNSAVEIYAVR
jgi:hypothetical protein